MESSLSTQVQYVKGVGPQLAGRLSKLGVTTLGDLLLHFPFRYIDCRQISPTGQVELGPHKVVSGEVVKCGVGFLGRSKRRIFRATIDDGSGPFDLVWFRFKQSYLEKLCSVGKRLLLTGDVSNFGKRGQMIHPEVEEYEDDKVKFVARIVPIYPSTDGVSQRLLRKIIHAAWETAGISIEEVLPDDVRFSGGLMNRAQAISALHFPDPSVDINELNSRRSIAHRTMIIEEMFFFELGMALRRAYSEKEIGIPLAWSEKAENEFRKILPFSLTGAQERVLKEIAKDMERAIPMRRLIQGDVGSGKTAVAAAACLQAIRAGYQVAVMAPTEILADQHYQSMTPWMKEVGVPVGLLKGSTQPKERDILLQQVIEGKIPLLIGTHALIEDPVQFAKLGLVIVDEQHRFGVKQRSALREKSRLAPDMLVLTATPIPRTLAMTAYGDLDLSVIDEMPPGRQPIITRHYTEKMREKLYAGILHELERGRQAYVVYPLVEDSEKMDLNNATDMSASLQNEFGPKFKVALLHGRMSSAEKEAVMSEFKSGRVHLLATTSVVEVGVDVPNATIMVIENAERFGLAQLHQLRGRVGRGTQQSYCILVAPRHGTPESQQRLTAMVKSNDGFFLAEEDLKIRGPGELLGTKQSGLPELKIARLVEDAALIAQARKLAFKYIENDRLLTKSPQTRHELMARWRDKLELALVG